MCRPFLLGAPKVDWPWIFEVDNGSIIIFCRGEILNRSNDCFYPSPTCTNTQRGRVTTAAERRKPVAIFVFAHFCPVSLPFSIFFLNKIPFDEMPSVWLSCRLCSGSAHRENKKRRRPMTTTSFFIPSRFQTKRFIGLMGNSRHRSFSYYWKISHHPDDGSLTKLCVWWWRKMASF